MGEGPIDQYAPGYPVRSVTGRILGHVQWYQHRDAPPLVPGRPSRPDVAFEHCALFEGPRKPRGIAVTRARAALAAIGTETARGRPA